MILEGIKVVVEAKFPASEMHCGSHVNSSKMAEEKDEEQTIAQDLVVTKYKMAAEMVNGVYHA